MKLKNNSNNEWKDYNCGGGVFVTIKPLSTFEVADNVGAYLLRMLGGEHWLTRVIDTSTKPEVSDSNQAKPESSIPSPAQATTSSINETKKESKEVTKSSSITSLRKPNTSKKK